MADSMYDVVVLGAGTGGLTVAKLSAANGKRVALIERAEPGGDCLYTGCVPTKALVHAAKVYHAAKHGARFGIHAGGVRLEYSEVRAHVERAQAIAGRPDTPEVIAAFGIDLLRGEGVFSGPHSIDVRSAEGTRTVRGRSIVIASGTEAATPPIAGLNEAGFDTNEGLLEWEELPGSLAIIGGGPIAIEFAQVMARFGVETTVIEALDRVLNEEDEEASTVIAGVLASEGVRVVTCADIERVERTGNARRVYWSGTERGEVEAERILVATGRRTSLGGLGLDRAGVEHGDEGMVLNDRLQTSQLHIYAVGDVAGGPQFTHVAEAQGRLVANLLNEPGRIARRFQRWSERVVPRVTYTEPEVASVGLTEAQARARYGDRFRSWRIPLDQVDRAATMGATEGFLKILAAPGWTRLVPGMRSVLGEEVIGACLVAPNAGELLPSIVTAMRLRIPLGLLVLNMQAYPTLALGVRQAIGKRFEPRGRSRR